MNKYVEKSKISARMMFYGFRAPDMTVTEFVDDLPVDDVREVKHGKWTKIRYQVYECSCCKRSVYLEGLNVTDENETKLLRELYPYCHCGAKMDRGGE